MTTTPNPSPLSAMLETCPAIKEPHICCNGPRDCVGTERGCHHCAPGDPALDALTPEPATKETTNG